MRTRLTSAVAAAAFVCLHAAAIPAATGAQERAYEIVTPGEAKFQVVAPDQSESVRWRMSSEGDAALYVTAAELGSDELGHANPFVARRTPSGWVSSYNGIPGSWRTGPASQVLLEATPRLAIAVSGVGVHPPMSPDPVLPFTTLILRDAAGALTWPFAGSGLPLNVAPGLVGMSDDGERAVLFIRSGPSRPAAMYKRDGDGIRLVSVAPDGGPLTALESSSVRSADRSVSSDGRRIFFFATDAGGTERLYVRLDGERTVAVADSLAAAPVTLEGITPSGDRALLETAAPLTSDDTDTSIDLFVATIGASGPVTLDRVSVGADGSSGNADTCGPAAVACNASSVGLAADGQAVYFGSPEVLASNAVPGGENLYVRRSGRTALVATVGPEDSQRLWGSSVRNGRAFSMTPDGARFAFLSRAALRAGYDNAGQAMLYVYNDARREILCVSCLPSGAPPTGDALGALGNGVTTFLTADGRRAFFESRDRLVPGDINDAQDIYEMDLDAGTIALVSAGRSTNAAEFWGASSDGRDVLFATFDVLVPQDRNGDGFLKVYDARVGGGFPVPPSASACQGDDCQPAAPPGPPSQRAATDGFVGATNRRVVLDESESAIGARRLSRSELARAARTGALRVRATGLRAPSRVTVTATARVRGVRGTVGRATRSVSRGTTARITVRLSKVAREELRRRRRLALRIRVEASSPRSSVTISGTLRLARSSR